MSGVFDFLATPKPQPTPDCGFELAVIEHLAREYPERMEIRWDEEAEVIWVGKWKISKYTNFKSMGAFVTSSIANNDVHGVSYHPKWRMKAAATVFGCGPRAFYGYFKKLQYKVFVVPHIEALTKISYIPGRISSNALEKIRQNREVVDEVMKDGLYNLLPLVAVTGLSPQQMRKEFGPAWKVLSKNSLNKNKAIVKSRSKEKWVNKFEISPEDIAARAEIPTTVLQNFAGEDSDVMKHIAKHYKGKWSKSDPNVVRPTNYYQDGTLTTKIKFRWSDILYEVSDTKRLAELVDQPFNPLWTPRKMKEKHDEYVKLNNALKYSPKPIEWVAELSPQILEHNGYKATLLNSRALIAEEGVEMGHCVAGYAESVAQERYLVYSITKDGERSSTLGISVTMSSTNKVKLSVVGQEDQAITISGGRFFHMNQHYGKFNQRLVGQAEIEIGKLVIAELNKENLKGNEND